MIEFLAFIFACAFGFGLALWIAGTILYNSNNFGDYHADASHYSSGVNFTSNENLKSSEGRESYVAQSQFKKPTLPLAPKGRELIKKASVSRVHHSAKAAVPEKTSDSKAVSESAPRRKTSSDFPRSFHDV